MTDEFKSLTVKMKPDDIALLNQRLKQCGFETVGDLVRAFAQGVLTSRELIHPLADEISNSIVSAIEKYQPPLGVRGFESHPSHF